MLDWAEFSERVSTIAPAGERLLSTNQVAFLATVSSEGRPRLHPFVPKIVDGKLVAFIVDRSPKFRDIVANGWYAIHAWPGPEDEEFYIAGSAALIDHDTGLRERAGEAMGFFTEIREDEKLVEFRIDRALWTRWLDFGTPNHRPEYQRWHATS